MSEIYLEMQHSGAYLKCTAVDSATGEEVMAVGPVNDPEGVKRLAVQKLKNKLQQKRGTPPPSRPGLKI